MLADEFTPAPATTPRAERAARTSELIRKAVQGGGLGQRFAELIAGNWEGFVKAYQDHQRAQGKSPLHIDPDEMAFLLPEYAGNRELRPDMQDALRKASGMAADLMYQQAVEDAPPGSKVVLNAGGPGAGKSQAARNDKALVADVSLDGTLANQRRAIERIDKAVEHGHEVVIRFVHQDPRVAVPGTIERARGDLRTVPAKDVAESNASAREALFALEKHYRGHPRVNFKVFDNTSTHPYPVAMSVAEFAKQPYERLSIDEAINIAKIHLDNNAKDIPASARRRILQR